MPTHADLIRVYISKEGKHHKNANLHHATLASSPERTEGLKRAVLSLLPQVDTLHVYLNDFENIPDFLIHEKIYITRSQDFGKLGECGKYYWVEDLQGYHFICSDRFIYPKNYVEELRKKIDFYERKVVVSFGAFHINKPFISFDASTTHLPETASRASDTEVELLKDSSLAFHSESLKISRHHFYQPELSSLWVSLLAKQRGLQMICQANSDVPILTSGNYPEPLSNFCDINDYRSFFVKAYFLNKCTKPATNNINTWFDRVYVMNLDRRTDRWDKVKRRLDDKHINVTRFPAVDGYSEPYMEQWKRYAEKPVQAIPSAIKPLRNASEKSLLYHHHVSRVHYMESRLGKKAIQSPGALGYALSYITILKEAISNEYSRILIFDDDIILHKHFHREFEKRMDMLPEDWLLIMLGAMQHHWEPTWISWYNDFMYHCRGSSVASHAVGLGKKAYLPVLYYAEKLDMPIDEGAVFYIQSIYSKQSFVCYPNLVIQDIGESEINSSALSLEEIIMKNNLFRWDYENYDV